MSTAPEARPLRGAAELAGAIGERVRIVGQAVDAKLAGALLVDGEPIYCLELDRWPDGVVGETVEVTGVLRRTDQFKATVAKDGAISQGTAGGDYVIDRCAYHILTVDQD